MVDSEDEILNRRKRIQPLIDSDEDEIDDKSTFHHDADSQLPSEVSDSPIKSQKISSPVPRSSFEDETCILTSDSESPAACPKSSLSPPRLEERNVCRKPESGSVNSCNSDFESESSRNDLMLNSRRSPSEKSNRLSSSDSETSNNVLIIGKNRRSASSDSSDDGGIKSLDAELNAAESNRRELVDSKITSNSPANIDNVVFRKVKKYKLLSDDDLSEKDGARSPDAGKNIVSEASDSKNSRPVEKSKLKKESRKKKLQKLNDLKKQEMKLRNSWSESDCEDRQSNEVSSPGKSVSPQTSPERSDSSDRDSDTKNVLKSGATSKARRKSKKVDPMLEIKSKTQKMIRENRVSLPYHQPKKRSLDEFLQRRKNAPSIPLKATIDVLHVVGAHLSRREEEVAVFYKSESEHSESDGERTSCIDQDQCNDSTGLKNVAELTPQRTDNVVASSETDCENRIAICNQEALENPPDNSKASIEKTNKENAEFVDKSAIESVNDDIRPEVFAVSNLEDTAKRSDICSNLDSETMEIDSNLLSGINTRNREIESKTFVSEQKDATEEALIDGVSGTDVASVTDAERDMDTSPSNTDGFDLTIHSSDTSVLTDSSKVALMPDEMTAAEECVKDVRNQPDTDDFDLMIQDSNIDSEASKITLENTAVVAKSDVRSKKLALLSKFNISLRNDVKLEASPNSVIEFETPFLSNSELGVFELKKKFSYHTTIRNKPSRKSSTKLSIVRTETDSQGEIIDVVKETIEVDCSEKNDDEESEKVFTPGSKHLKFREQMRKTLVAKKQAAWLEYQNEKRKLYDSRTSDDEGDFDDEDAEKPDFEPYHPEEEPDDDELLENDVEIEDKVSKRNDFVDDEAEVSNEEEDEDSEKENAVEELADDEAEVEDDEDAVEDDEGEAEDDKGEAEDDEGEAEDDEAEGHEKKDAPVQAQASADCSTDAFKKPLPSQNCPLFKHNITGTDLENKVLGLESMFSQKSQITSSQLVDVCSGKFITQTDRLNSSDASDLEFFADSQQTEDSQNFNLSLQDTNDGYHNADLNKSENRNALFFSDDSDNEELFARKKKLIQLQDSDDETDVPVTIDDANPNEQEDADAADGDIDASNDEEEADEADALIDDDEELAYNSEEEIVAKKNAQEFFENEAELSESEWGSEDENENDLDVLEKEAGDDEDLDQEALKEELGKIHMRQMLDDDQNDVRALKELLLEDGELHSDGKRQRKFQWSNLDDNGFFSKMTNDSDDEALKADDDEEEADANWRKIRHEREMFISQQEKNEELMKNVDDENDDSLPQLEAGVRRVTPVASNKPNIVNSLASPDLKLPFKARFKCGSFLAKGKMLLNRIAVTVGECRESNVTGGAKNHRNFVFAARSPEKELPDVVDGAKAEKRKISSKSVIARKKLKLAAPVNKGGLLAQLALSD